MLHFQGGDDIHHVRTYAEIVTVPDPEILMVSIKLLYYLITKDVHRRQGSCRR